MLIDARTRLLGFVGDPIGEARSPRLVNALLEQRGVNAIVVPMAVRAGLLPACLGGLRTIDAFTGAMITMPHKTVAASLVDGLSAEAAIIGACNVIRRTSDGRLIGAALDGEGFVAGLRNAGFNLAGTTVYMAGAGGAAAAIAFAMGKYGVARLTLYNRTHSKALALAARVAAAWPKLEVKMGDSYPDGHDLVINATSVGMAESDTLPFSLEKVSSATHVAEVVVQMTATALLVHAARLGCPVHPGLSMLKGQLELMVDFMLGEAGLIRVEMTIR